MLGGAVIAAMQKAYSENRALGRRKHEKSAGIDHLTYAQRKEPLKYKVLSPLELAEFREKLQVKKKQEQRKYTIALVISAILVVVFMFYLFA